MLTRIALRSSQNLPKERSLLKLIAATCAAACLAAPVFAASLTTGFAGGNGGDGNVFDIQIGAADITVTALELNLESVDADMEVYYRLGGYIGNTGSTTGWTLWDTATALAANARGTPTPWDVVDQGFAAGQTYGIYVTTTDGERLRYTNGTTEGSVLASDAALTIFEGRGVTYPFFNTFFPRKWNGTMIYDVASVSASPVPLPAALPLALLGFGALAAVARRRRA
jgi:hypothetical protein